MPRSPRAASCHLALSRSATDTPAAIRRVVARSVGAASLALVIAAPGAAQNAASSPLQVRDVLSVRTFASRNQIGLSPDGRFVAFALRNPMRVPAGDRAGYFGATGAPSEVRGTDVFITEVLAAKTTNLTNQRGSSWSPVWSPDGRTLAFLSDRDGQVRVWLWNRAQKQLRRLSPEPVRTFFGFEDIRWSPNGRRIAVKLSPRGMTRADLDRLLPTDSTSSRAPRSADSVTAVVFDATSIRDTATSPPLAVNLD